MANEYYEFWKENCPWRRDFYEILHGKEPRTLAIEKWGFAVPNDEAIQKIAQLTPIVEVGCGTGYWSLLLREEGAVVTAFDKYVDPRCGDYSFRHPYVSIQQGGPESLPGRPKNEALFLCWPHFADELATRCLQSFEGDWVAYVGEDRWGCCAEDSFFDLLDEEWELVETVDIPTWDGINDELQIWTRR